LPSSRSSLSDTTELDLEIANRVLEECRLAGREIKIPQTDEPLVETEPGSFREEMNFVLPVEQPARRETRDTAPDDSDFHRRPPGARLADEPGLTHDTFIDDETAYMTADSTSGQEEEIPLLSIIPPSSNAFIRRKSAS
jgi:hypothetical protein